MRVLMFGWEFPPHIAGGLGTACYGMTKGLAYNDVDVLFVMPSASGDEDESAVKIITHAADLYIPFEELVNLDEERARLTKELEKASSELSRVKGKLANEGFVAKAPAKLIEAEKAKLEKYETMVKTLTEALEKL